MPKIVKTAQLALLVLGKPEWLLGCCRQAIGTSQKGRLDIVKMMLENDNVDASLKNIAGLTARDAALACGMFEVAQFLSTHKLLKAKKICSQQRKTAHQYQVCSEQEFAQKICS